MPYGENTQTHKHLLTHTHTRQRPPPAHTHTMADASISESSSAFTTWRYNHYFQFVGIKDAKNITVKCKLCAGQKALSTSNNSNANLLKHLTNVHGAIKLVAKDPTVSTTGSDPDGATPSKQPKNDFFKSPHVTQSQLNRLIARYVVEDMLPIATVESVAFRELVSKIPVKAVKAGPQCRKTFSNNTKTCIFIVIIFKVK